MKYNNMLIVFIAIIILLFVLGGFGYGMMGYPRIEIMGYYGLGMGFFGWLFMILIIIVLILLIVWLTKQIQGDERKKHG